MNVNQRLADLKNQHETLMSICGPRYVSDIRPKGDQRDKYRSLVMNVLRDINLLERAFAEAVFDDKVLHQSLPEQTLHYYRETILPSRRALEQAFDRLDPILADFFKTVDKQHDSAKTQRKVTRTFEVAIDRMVELVSDNPDLSDHFDIDGAYRIIESPLLEFDPNAWLLNSESLRPIRTSAHPDVLSISVRRRLLEIYRSYVFGNWLSVLILSRSALEYALIDNASKLGVSTQYATTTGSKQKTKKLSHLIDDIAYVLPELKGVMEEIRELGNEFIHPEKSKRSRERMFEIRKEATRSLALVQNVLQTLYAASVQPTVT